MAFLTILDLEIKQKEQEASIKILEEAAGIVLEVNESSYDELKSNNFNRAFSLSNPKIKELSLNSKKINQSIAYAKLKYEQGEVLLSNRLINILYPIAETNETITSLAWARLFSLVYLSVTGTPVDNSPKEIKTSLRILQYTIDQKPLKDLMGNVTNRSTLFLMMVIAFLYLENKGGIDYDFLMEILTQETYLVSLSLDNPVLFRYLVVIYSLCHNNTRFNNFKAENLLKVITQGVKPPLIRN